MLQAKTNPGAIEQGQKDGGADFANGASLPAREAVIFIAGCSRLLVALWIAVAVLPFSTTAFAQAHEDRSTMIDVVALPASGAYEAVSAAFDLAALPSPDSIDA